MPKREIEIEPMDEEPVEAAVPTVGERLQAAREEKRLSLEDIAAQTRIPQRHLESIETAEWDKLPAPTYTVGFAKSYASAVGLDRTEIGEQLREEMGGQRFTASQSEVIEAADPARTMPKWLVHRRDHRGRLPGRADELAQPPLARAADEPCAATQRCTAAAAARRRTTRRHPRRRRRTGRADRHRAGVDPGHRPGQEPVRGDASARPDLCRAADGGRADAEGGRARSAQDQRRLGRRPAGRAAGQDRLEGQPQGRGSDARAAGPRPPRRLRPGRSSARQLRSARLRRRAAAAGGRGAGHEHRRSRIHRGQGAAGHSRDETRGWGRFRETLQ